MGWSELTARPDIDTVFKRLRKKYVMRRVIDPAGIIIQIQYEGNLGISSINTILELFPDHIYVEFQPNITFAPEDEGDTYVRSR
jgi:hypothetical protein